MEPLKNTKKLSEILIDEYTSPATISADKDTSVMMIRKLMDENNIRHVPILEEGSAVGLITDRDLKILGNLNFTDNVTASDIMINNPFSVVAGSSLENVIFDMSERKIGSVLVEDTAGNCVGIFTYIDAMNALIEILRGEAE